MKNKLQSKIQLQSKMELYLKYPILSDSVYFHFFIEKKNFSVKKSKTSIFKKIIRSYSSLLYTISIYLCFILNISILLTILYSFILPSIIIFAQFYYAEIYSIGQLYQIY